MKWLQKIPNFKIVNREEFLIEYCTGKTVLHLGFVDSEIIKDKILSNNWLHSKLNDVCKVLWGIDVDKEGINFAKNNGYKNVTWGNVEEPNSIKMGKKFDVVLAADIIEHLSNMKGLLETIKINKKSNGVGIITTPNAMRCYNPIISLFGYELIHPTHTTWFSVTTIKYLVESFGYKTLGIYMFQNTNKFKPKLKNRFLKKLIKTILYLVDAFLRRTLIRICPSVSDGIIVIIQ